mgnify:CR=1 FL=1
MRALLPALAVLLSGCQSMDDHPPLRLAENVDLQRFMGDWYVIANIPTFIEKGAHNAVESYRLAPDGNEEIVPDELSPQVPVLVALVYVSEEPAPLEAATVCISDDGLSEHAQAVLRERVGRLILSTSELLSSDRSA